MDGVTILAQEAITSFNKPLTAVVAIIAVVLCAIVHFLLIANDIIVTDDNNAFMVCLALCLCLTSALLCSKFTEYKTNEYQYIVTVDDTVQMSEFYDKYIIIEQKDSLFTVRPRRIAND